jgi:hypothetical protein
MGVALEPSGFSSGVTAMTLQELEGRFMKLELHTSSKTRQIPVCVTATEVNIVMQRTNSRGGGAVLYITE